jgi:hypothetical protein
MGGGMGGMGCGFMSVPPTGTPYTTLKAGQTRHLPTRLVALTQPQANDPLAAPQKGEELQIGDIGQLTDDAKVQAALKRLAKDKAPQTVSQLVMWRVAGGLEWATIANLSKGWANAHELTLAQQFVEQLDGLAEGESGTMLYDVRASNAALEPLASEIGTLLKGKNVLGLRTKSGAPARPEGPAVLCRISVSGTASKPEALVQVLTSDATASKWLAAGKFTLPLARESGKLKGVEFGNAMAEGVLGRLVRAQLSKGSRVKGKDTYKVRIDNASPLILNGLAVAGTSPKEGELPKVLSGISLSPRKSLTLPASLDVVDQLGLKGGVRVIAADLSGL